MNDIKFSFEEPAMINPFEEPATISFEVNREILNMIKELISRKNQTFIKLYQTYVNIFGYREIGR
jgi:hypothetical protein